jgi:hypothetical protein
MKKLTVKEASEHLGITREAIYNRIRRGSLKSVTESNIKYVLLEDDQIQKPTQTAQSPIQTTHYEEYLKEQIAELKSELKEAKQKIDTLYQEKDDQLRSIIQITLAQTRTQIPPQPEPQPQESVIEASIKEQRWIKLSKLLKKLEIPQQKQKKIIKKLTKKANKSKHIKIKNDTLFVNKNKQFKEIYAN